MNETLPRHRVLVAGAGDIGTRIGLGLLARGHEVFALRRNPAKLPAGLSPIAGDLCDPRQLRAVPSGLSHVVYAAAADESNDAAYQRAYVTGLSNVLALAQLRSSPTAPRVLFISSTAVYAQADDEWVDEDSPCAPSRFAGVRMLEAEGLLAASGLPHTAFRCSGIYGPGRTRLIEEVQSGRAAYDPASNQYTNRIHADDVAGAAVHLLLHPACPERVIGVDDEPARRRDVLTWLAERLGVNAPRALPGAGGGRAAGSKRLCNRRLEQLGYRFVYPTFREGYGALLDLNPGDRSARG